MSERCVCLTKCILSLWPTIVSWLLWLMKNVVNHVQTVYQLFEVPEVLESFRTKSSFPYPKLHFVDSNIGSRQRTIDTLYFFPLERRHTKLIYIFIYSFESITRLNNPPNILSTHTFLKRLRTKRSLRLVWLKGVFMSLGFRFSSGYHTFSRKRTQRVHK